MTQKIASDASRKLERIRDRFSCGDLGPGALQLLVHPSKEQDAIGPVFTSADLCLPPAVWREQLLDDFAGHGPIVSALTAPGKCIKGR